MTPDAVSGASGSGSTAGRPHGGRRDGRDGAFGRTGDALALALAILEGPWTSAICRELLASVRSFGEIRRAVPGLSANVLARRLRRLESDGVVVRIAGGAAGGTRGAYGLSPWGRSIASAFGEIVAWGSAGPAEARGILKGMDDD